MRDFNDRRSYGPPRGGRRFGNNNRRGGGFGRDNDRQMHDATCAECGTACQVPFFPTGSKPVFCSDCFEHQSVGGSDRSDRDRSSFSRPSYAEKRSFTTSRAPQHNGDSKKLDMIIEKLDQLISIMSD